MGAALAHSRSKTHSHENLNNAWNVLTKIKLILCVGLLLWMKLGFTITNQNPNSSQNSGQKPAVPKKIKSIPSARKFMASVFWDAEGILFIDYLEKGKTITGEYYSNLLTRLDEKIHEKRPGLQKKHFSSGQCPCPQKCFGNGKIKGSAL